MIGRWTLVSVAGDGILAVLYDRMGTELWFIPSVAFIP